MRITTRILGFVAIGFVLAFFGKVSKSGVYKAYLKTIQECSVKNTTRIQAATYSYSVSQSADAKTAEPMPAVVLDEPETLDPAENALLSNSLPLLLRYILSPMAP